MLHTRDDEIDVETIMGRIREAVERRRAGAGTLHDPPFSARLHHCLYILKVLQDPKPQGPIASHGGPVIGWLKGFIRRVLSSYHRGIFARQSEFNTNAIHAIVELTSMLDKHAAHMERRLGELTGKDENLAERFEEMRLEAILQRGRLDLILSELRKTIGNEREPLKRVASLKERLMDYSYFLFENKYRLSREVIKKRQEIYVPTFKESLASVGVGDRTPPLVVLDVGCGRGEFLELLGEQGIPAKGIDLNDYTVHFCRERGLDVEQGNALDYLRVQPDDSLGGILACQVIEHLGVEEMTELLKLCCQKLIKGGRAVFETVNPLSLVVSATNFYVDLSHIRQVHPTPLQFLAETIGFSKTEIKFLEPFPDESKLQLLNSHETTFQQIDENFKRLNEILFGYQDYALICEK